MRHLLLLAGCLTATACGASKTGSANSPQPAPSPRPPAAPASKPAGGSGAAVTYQPSREAAYVIHRLDSITLHLPGGETQQQLLDRTAYIRLTLAEGSGAPRGEYRATIVLDSLRATASAMTIMPDSLAVARGTRWTATVTPTGRLSGLTADRSTTLGDQLTNHLRLLFPTLPAAGARAGMGWSDSVQFALKADVFDATERAQTNYQAVDDSRGIKIESVVSYTRAGKGVQFNQRLDMNGSGKRQGTHYLGHNGVLLSAEGTDVGEMKILVPAVGQVAPVTQRGRYQIRRLQP